LTGHSIEAILITDKGGSPRFYIQLDPRAFGMDPVLGSSFFAAIDMFSQQVFDQDTPVFQVDYGARVFTIIHGVETNLIAACIRRLDEKVIEVLDSLLGEFELDWLPVTQSFDFDESFTEMYLEAFGESVMKKLSFQELPDSWIPYFTIKPDTVQGSISPLIPFIDGSRSVKEIRKVSNMPEREIIVELSKLWAQRVIRFRNMLSFKDFLSSRTQFMRYIQATSAETKDLQNLHPEMIGIIPRLAGLIDGRRTVHEILHELGANYDEREVLRALDYLREQEVIEALSPEKRRILLAKEILELALRSADSVYGSRDTSNTLRTVMKRIESPEILSQLNLKDDQWQVDFGFSNLEGMNPNRVMRLFGEWTKILAQFALALDRRRLDKFVIKLTSEIHRRIVNRYASYDLSGIEEFSFWLEQLTTEAWHKEGLDRTYPLEKIGTGALEDMVFELVTRGQAIYGSETIVGLCGAAGIPLVDGLPVLHIRHTRTEAFEQFTIEYSQLCPAALLTVLIMSRQRDIALPKEIVF
jgi:hypothetical protein